MDIDQATLKAVMKSAVDDMFDTKLASLLDTKREPLTVFDGFQFEWLWRNEKENSWANTNAEIPKELSFSGKRTLACQMETRLQNQVSNRIKIEKCRYQKNENSDNLDGPKPFWKTMKNIFQVTRRKPQFHSALKLIMGKLFILLVFTYHVIKPKNRNHSIKKVTNKAYDRW